MTTTMNIKAVDYCRVSSKEQEDTGYSLPAQEKLLDDYAKRKDFHVVKVFSVAESASGAKQRKVFSEMIEYMRRNKVGVLLCEKVDRLTRNLKEAVMVNDWLAEDESRSIHFVKQNLVIHKDAKSDEKFRWDIEIVLAKKYISNLSEEVKKGQMEKLAQGWLPTKPPLGYKTIGDKGHKIHVVDADIAPYMRKMFEWYATGNYSISRLEKELYQTGMRTRGGYKLGMSRIHTMLQEVFYHGKIQWNGKFYTGKHEPLISKDTFDKVQSILRRKTKNPHLAKHNSLFKSKIFCEHCEGMLTWYTQKGHWYGHCNNHGAYARCAAKTCMREEAVESQIVDIFDVIAPKNEDILTAIVQILKDQHQEKVLERQNEERRLNTSIGNIRSQKDRLYEAKLNREVPADFVERKLAELTIEEEALESALVRVGDDSDIYKAVGIAVHELAFYCKKIYETADVDPKRLLFSQLFTNLVQDRLEIKKNYTEAAQFLLEWIPKLNKDYELQNTHINKRKTGTFAPVSPIWLRG